MGYKSLLAPVMAFMAVQLVLAKAPGKSKYTVGPDFPTAAFTSYYYGPEPTREPQPKIYDPVLDLQYPLNLTDPNTIPIMDDDAPILPVPAKKLSQAEKQMSLKKAEAKIAGIFEGSQGNCSKCIASLDVLQGLAKVAPRLTSRALVMLCEKYIGSSSASCESTYAVRNFGAIWTQVLTYANVSGLDGQYICYTFSSTFCPKPSTQPLNTTGLFPKPKPKNAKAPASTGKRLKVAHLSDLHLDPRYAVGAEGSCTSGLCCRANNGNSSSPVLPAPLYGAFKCDTPYYLALAALQAIHPLTGTSSNDKGASSLAFTIYTGDLVSHDEQPQLSRAYTEYAETSVYHLLQQYVRGPIFPVLGNHDSNPEAIDAPHSLPGKLGKQFSWNYNHVAALWQNDFQLPADAADQARLHYAGYSVKTQFGLKIMTLNTDFWYHSNYLNYINTTNPDNSGMLSWLIDELQAAEDAGERVWILGHVLTGWDGSNPLPDPTNLFYKIVERYSPHVIANLFFGHTHEDFAMIYYANNGTNRNNAKGISDALAVGWVGPSITPLTNLNSGFRMYEVDSGSFEVMDAYTFYSDVSSFPDLNVTDTGPTFYYEYSTRDTYLNGTWPADAPLNATYWHKVSEELATDLALTETFNTYQGKSSVQSPACNTTACQAAKVCYLRSGSAPLGRECPQGYGSVQSPFDPPS